MNQLSWLALCLSIILLAGCGVPDENSQVNVTVEVNPTMPELAKTTLVAPTLTRTIVPSLEPAIQSTERPEATVLLDIARCQQTFCPPYWLTDQANQLLGIPGIHGGEGINELQILLSYDPTLHSEEEVVQIFIEITGFEVDVFGGGG